MEKRLLKHGYVLFAATLFALAFPAVLFSQVTEYQENQWLNTPAATSHIGNIKGNPHAAATPYRRYCVGCHGELGDGNGENAMWLDPKPRDFQLGICKF